MAAVIAKATAKPTNGERVDVDPNDPNATTHLQWLLDMRNMILERWLVVDAVKAYGATPRAEPAAYAAAFLDKSSVSFHEHLWDMTDPEDWKQAFVLHDVDAVWLEQLRAAFDKALDTPDDGPAPRTDEERKTAEEKGIFGRGPAAGTPAGTGQAAGAAKPEKKPRKAKS